MATGISLEPDRFEESIARRLFPFTRTQPDTAFELLESSQRPARCRREMAEWLKSPRKRVYGKPSDAQRYQQISYVAFTIVGKEL